MKINAKKMKLDLMLGALGALLMVVGDLALSIILTNPTGDYMSVKPT